jgi:UPF0755 protein
MKFRILITIIFFLLLVTISYEIYDLFKFNTKEDKIIVLPPGISTKDIAHILKENGVIANENKFLILSNLAGITRKLHSGTYRFTKGSSLLKILYMLTLGKTYTIKITIPEGYTSNQIAELLQNRNIIKNKDEFIKIVKKNNLEGYLFPETYFFAPNLKPEEIIDRMTKEFNNRFLPEFELRCNELKMTKNDIVILASIIEKEAKTDTDRKLISAVFHNRLKKKWLLESCATVRYALNKYKGPLIYKDLKVNSVYNTYIHYGLPPGAICNPGLNSIKAALYPSETDAMFFFTKDNNRHKFSKYYSQHLAEQKK